MGVVLGTLRTALSAAFHRGFHLVFPARALPLQPSAAQSCNDDILDLIFSQVAERDLLSLAITCRRWSPAAYRLLYACVAFFPSPDKGTVSMEALARTLNGSEHVRSFIRDLKLASPEGPIPQSLFDWLELIPEGAIRSLIIWTPNGGESDASQLMDTLLRSPMLNSVQALGMSNGEAFFEGVNRMSQLLASTPNVSHIFVDFRIPGDSATLPRCYAPFTPIPCHRVRHLTVRIRGYTPLFGDLLQILHSTLEVLRCDTSNSDAFDFQHELQNALEMTSSSSLQTLILQGENMRRVKPLLSFPSGSWPSLRELIVIGWRLEWESLSAQLPTSLGTLVTDYTFSIYGEFPIDSLTTFVENAFDSHPEFKCLVICNVFGYSPLFVPLEEVCSKRGVSLRLYSSLLPYHSEKFGDHWTLEGMLSEMQPITLPDK